MCTAIAHWLTPRPPSDSYAQTCQKRRRDHAPSFRKTAWSFRGQRHRHATLSAALHRACVQPTAARGSGARGRGPRTQVECASGARMDPESGHSFYLNITAPTRRRGSITRHACLRVRVRWFPRACELSTQQQTHRVNAPAHRILCPQRIPRASGSAPERGLRRHDSISPPLAWRSFKLLRALK
ncbi:hypothetical protein HYPSUDRAFT_366015 [Hypholoma sublateritium FD-334 SS-4]|uniref:Uncharacterized protein n=1 Tax=Hypholoma sublateritium (strain FD-334 SS-4) TaxID=945553 RepID=A0A0D2LX79_HYPSF|nr:hypothetical protein HYPSUDRAFT_366015 [Hypholoma sublateritium FD-334 SS-4]